MPTPNIKTFVGATVLTASDVNDYLMKQTVIYSTSSLRPTSPQDGMTIYESDLDRYKTYHGGGWYWPATIGVWNGSTAEGTFLGTSITANRSYTLPDVSGTVITTGNLSSITAVGTLTSGSIPATLLTGTIASARLSGSYTGITGVGTLTGLTIGGAGSNRFITINAPTGYYAIQYFAINGTNEWHYEVPPSGASWSLIESGVAERVRMDSDKLYVFGQNANSPQLELGDWNQDGRYAALRTNFGYLLLGSTGVNGNIYLRTDAPPTGSGGNVYIGASNNNTLEVGSASLVINGTGTSTGNFTSNTKLRAGNVSYQTYDAYAGILFHESYSGAQYQVRVGEFYSESAVGSINGYSFTVYAGNELHLRSRYGATNVILLSSAEWCYVRLYPTTSANTVRDAGFGLIGYFSSRAEIKENVESVSDEDALNRVLNMRPVEFNFKQSAIGDGDNPMVPLDRKRGFIADEMAALDHKLGSWGWVNPDNSLRQVELNSDQNVSLEDAVPIYWDHDAVIADLVGSIQNLEHRLKQLEA